MVLMAMVLMYRELIIRMAITHRIMETAITTVILDIDITDDAIQAIGIGRVINIMVDGEIQVAGVGRVIATAADGGVIADKINKWLFVQFAFSHYTICLSQNLSLGHDHEKNTFNLPAIFSNCLHYRCTHSRCQYTDCLLPCWSVVSV